MPYETSGALSLGTGVVTVDARDASVVGGEPVDEPQYRL